MRQALVSLNLERDGAAPPEHHCSRSMACGHGRHQMSLRPRRSCIVGLRFAPAASSSISSGWRPRAGVTGPPAGQLPRPRPADQLPRPRPRRSPSAAELLPEADHVTTTSTSPLYAPAPPPILPLSSFFWLPPPSCPPAALLLRDKITDPFCSHPSV